MAEEKKVIPTPQPSPPAPETPRNIPLENIHDLPGILIRKRIDKDLGGLVQSVKSQGVMEPVVLRLREDGKFQMVAGYRRMWASELAGKSDIPALVRDMALNEAQEYAAKSNSQDKSKTPIPGKQVLPEKPKAETAPTGTPAPDAEEKKPNAPIKAPGDGKPAPAGAPVPGKPTEEKKTDELGKTPGDGTLTPPGVTAPGKPAVEKKADTPIVPDPQKAPVVPPIAQRVKDKLAELEAEAAKKTAATDKDAPGKPTGKVINMPTAKGATDKAAEEPGPVTEADIPASFTLPLTGQDKAEEIVRLKISDIHDFPNHPFEVRDDKEMKDMAESVRKFGILVPATVIPRKEGGYEMVSGHRRKHAAQLAGLTELPVIIRQWDRDEAVIAMVDSNIQRENISPMEKARAYKMKLEAMKRKSGPLSRAEKAAGAVQPEKRSDQLLAEQVGESRNTVQRFIRLNELAPDLQDMVDSGKLPVGTAVELSFVPKTQQQDVADLLNRGHTISASQATEIKEASKKGPINADKVYKIIEPPRKEPDMKVVLTGDRLRKYFPDVSMTPNEVAESIYGALEDRRQREQKRQQIQEKKQEKAPSDKREEEKSAPAPVQDKTAPPTTLTPPLPKTSPAPEPPQGKDQPTPKPEPDRKKDPPVKKPPALTR